MYFLHPYFVYTNNEGSSGSAHSPKSSLLDNAILTKILCDGSLHLFKL